MMCLGPHSQIREDRLGPLIKIFPLCCLWLISSMQMEKWRVVLHPNKRENISETSQLNAVAEKSSSLIYTHFLKMKSLKNGVNNVTFGTLKLPSSASSVVI